MRHPSADPALLPPSLYSPSPLPPKLPELAAGLFYLPTLHRRVVSNQTCRTGNLATTNSSRRTGNDDLGQTSIGQAWGRMMAV
jgi:hypothetical protein